MKSIRERAKEIADRSYDAYSARRYASWASVAGHLLRRGYSERETEAIMRSKFARWAADMRPESYGRAPGKLILAYLDRDIAQRGTDVVAREIAEMAQEL